ncbi:hypothetical protein LC724_33065 [Blautia sp. RD014234]|nr:hypothetical protein [Blautia parvula]
MREEASPKQWEKLYEVTCNLKALEPWKYFWDTQLVAIFLKDSEEPVFASIMGCGGNCYGISVYEGLEGLRDFDMIASTEETGLPPDYAMLEQHSLTCYFGDREEVPRTRKRRSKNWDSGFGDAGNGLSSNPVCPGSCPVRRMPGRWRCLREPFRIYSWLCGP